MRILSLCWLATAGVVRAALVQEEGMRSVMVREEAAVGSHGEIHRVDVESRVSPLRQVLTESLDYGDAEKTAAVVEHILGEYARDNDLTPGGGEQDLAMFNDYYKWAMFPVVATVCKAHKDPIVTFGVSIRELMDVKAPDAYQIVEEAEAEITVRLQNLVNRKFTRESFQYPYTGMSGSFGAVVGSPVVLSHVFETSDVTQEYVEKLLASHEGRGFIYPEILTSENAPMDDPNLVYLRMFKRPTLDTPEGRIVIEAVGPYYAVTWLETTLMQAVYAGLRDYQMAGFSEEERQQDFIGAIERCKKSCDDWVKQNQAHPVEGAANRMMFLFSGRRTLGSAMLAFQIAYMSKHPEFDIKGTSAVVPHYLLDVAMREAGFDKSDNDAVAWHFWNFVRFRVVGTHAHELSMVLGGLYYEEDERAGMPVSQLLGHMLFREFHAPRGSVPFLPDTLGTRAFVEAAKAKNVYQHFNTARQDSGSQMDGLDKFQVFAKSVNGPDNSGGKKLFASEIDTAADLASSMEAGFMLFGAGGFFGDSVKTDPTHSGPKPPSMAVKAVKVVSGGKTRYCIKFGDPTVSKLEIDPTAPEEDIVELVRHAYNLATFYKAGSPNVRQIKMELAGASSLVHAKEILKKEFTDYIGDDANQYTLPTMGAPEEMINLEKQLYLNLP